MNLALNIKEQYAKTVGVNAKVVSNSKSNIEYAIFRGQDSCYLLIANVSLNNICCKVQLDALCVAIKQSVLPNAISPLAITNVEVAAICSTTYPDEQNVKFLSVIAGERKITEFSLELNGATAYLLTIK